MRLRGVPRLALSVMLFLSFPTFRLLAAYDAFIRFTNPQQGAGTPKGESQDSQFLGSDGWFEIASFNEGIMNTVELGSEDVEAAVGKGQFNDFVFTKTIDAASPKLFEASAKGGSYGKVDLALRQSGGANHSQAPFYTATLEKVYITSILWSGDSGDDLPLERVETEFGELRWSYTRFDAGHSPVTTLSVNWDQIQNRGEGVLEQTPVPPTLSYPSSALVAAGASLIVKPATGPSSPWGLAGMLVKSSGGYTGGIGVDQVTGEVALTGANPAGGPFTIVIEVTDNNFFATDASFAVTVTPGAQAVLANPDNTTRVLGRSTKIPVANLLANDSAGAVFDSLPSDSTTLKGQVTVVGSTIIYQPPVPDPGSDDTFSYRIRNSFGQTADGTVTVGVSAPNGGPTGNLIIRASAAGTDLRLAGIPGRRYQLQTAPSANGPWTNFGNDLKELGGPDPVTADQNGLAEWLDTDAASVRFYRAFNVP